MYIRDILLGEEFTMKRGTVLQIVDGKLERVIADKKKDTLLRRFSNRLQKFDRIDWLYMSAFIILLYTLIYFFLRQLFL